LKVSLKAASLQYQRHHNHIDTSGTSNCKFLQTATIVCRLRNS